MKFIESLRLNRNYPICMLFDLLWAMLITVLWIFTINIIFSSLGPYEELSKIGFDAQYIMNNYGTIPNSMIEEAKVAYEQTKSFFWKSSILLILFTVVTILISSLIKGAIWARVQKKRYDKKYIIGFIKLNYVWYLGWTFIIMLTTLLPKAAIIILIPIELFVMFLSTPLIRVKFNPKKGVTYNLKKSLDNFKPRLLLAGLLMYLIIQLIIILAVLTSFSYYIAPFITFVLVIWYISWTRHYLHLILK